MSWPWTASFALAGALLVLSGLPARADCEAGFEAFDSADYKRAFRHLLPCAEAGDPIAQFNLGVMYGFGDGVPQDNAEAARWFRMAAEQGDAPAQYNLGHMYANGEGMSQDDVQAVRWYRMAAEQGHAKAQNNLGFMYENGRGVAQDHAETMRWYRMAADHGDAQAQFNLGVGYYYGKGLPQDDLLAYMWSNLAAARSPPGEQRQRAAELRDEVAARLSPAQRARGQELARDWQPSAAARATGESPDRWWEEDPLLDSTGTGFAVSQDGHLLTNHHVVADCTEVRVHAPRVEASGDLSHVRDCESDEYAGLLVPVETAAVIVARDPSNDLALLTAPLCLPAPVNLDDGGIRPGDSVVAVGFPLPGLLASEPSVTTGTVSALAGIGNDTRLLQVTVPVQPGNSGGPLLDLHGRVVGVVVGKLDALQVASVTGDIPQNVNFATEASVVRSFLATNGLAYLSDENTRGDQGRYERELSPATVGAQAKAFTVLLECWK